MPSSAQAIEVACIDLGSSSAEGIDAVLKRIYNEAARPDLKKDFRANISGARENNMPPHMYSSVPLWADVIRNPDYYPPRSDKMIGRKHKAWLKDFSREVNATIYNEMGAGDEFALIHKTAYLAQMFGVQNAVLIDFSIEALHNGALHFTDRQQKLASLGRTPIGTYAMMRNFNYQSFRPGLPGPKIFALLGLTAGNAEDDDLSINLRHYLTQMDEEDVLIMSVDRNLDPLPIFRAYGTAFQTWVDDMRRYLEENFGEAGYNPANFRYFRHWDDKTHVLQFGLEAKRPGVLTIDGTPVTYAAREYKYLPSRRFTQEKLDGFYKKTTAPAAEAGREKYYELVNILPDDNDWVCWQILRVKTRPVSMQPPIAARPELF